MRQPPTYSRTDPKQAIGLRAIVPGSALADAINPRRRRFVSGSAALLALALTAAGARAEGRDTGRAKIGVIGSGHIGGTVGSLWVKAGHAVMFSSRHPEGLRELVSGLGGLARAGTVPEAIGFGDVLLIAVPYGALPQIGKDYAAELRGKVVLDACNAVPARDGAALAEEVERGGIGVTSQNYLPGTRLVRAFNTLNYRKFASEANRPAPRLAVPIAGDDAEAVRVAADLVRSAGFDPVVVGKLAEARRFQRGAAGYGQEVGAAELKQKLSLSP